MGFSEHLSYSDASVTTFEYFSQKGPGTSIFFKMSKHHVRKKNWMCILKKKGITQAVERQMCRNSLLKPYLSGLSGDSLFYENEVMSVLSL